MFVGLTEHWSVLCTEENCVVDDCTAAFLLWLCIPAHKDAFVISFNTDNRDIPWICREHVVKIRLIKHPEITFLNCKEREYDERCTSNSGADPVDLCPMTCLIIKERSYCDIVWHLFQEACNKRKTVVLLFVWQCCLVIGTNWNCC